MESLMESISSFLLSASLTTGFLSFITLLLAINSDGVSKIAWRVFLCLVILTGLGTSLMYGTLIYWKKFG